MLRIVFHPLRTATPIRPLAREAVLDSLKLTCAAALFASPWIIAFTPAATWNLWVCGYAVLTISLAALVAEADWEPSANFWLGAWIIAAPWILDFSVEPEATFVHMVGGGLVSILSAVELWTAERNPPWRFRPGAARRVSLAPPMTGWPQASAHQSLHNPIFARRRASVPRRRCPRLRGTTASLAMRGRQRRKRPAPSDGRGHDPERLLSGKHFAGAAA